ncbi:DsbE family thiol:disulfide interchange protein [Celeribacter marinus]|uniref:Cytochrome c-type biogenesis protein CcmG/DsbE, thiol:disulfide oxidoreductase n=1 Tax=Celeribacter marinus TaxID=1397108 RepID=A0A0P0A9W2_9RHOB|nr:DsbE family thiol:disulfide interchange protein [Celeribacter marinus]ALI54642.1 cytochrome c-type biogenesis protein CcmG/DsbE, thiol:disulfide oxidoreductase [Celeribacter marinus]SFK51975.1 cytochrome c biogenesis protein CcmG, thiol:disulfide interchange protein DsbE [Celeribacter marinus]
MPKISPLMAAPPLLFAVLAGLFIFGMGRDDASRLPTAQAGKDAPSIAALTPLGDLAPLSDEMLDQGGVKLVNYWASWCAPCRAEHPQLEAMAQSGITIYGINYKDEAPKALGFLNELGNPYAAIGQDSPGRTALEWGVYGVPETYVIDAKGKITYRFAGPITQDVLDKYIKPEIAKAAAN